MASTLHPKSRRRETLERVPVQHAMCKAFLPSSVVRSRSESAREGWVERKAGRAAGSLDPAARRSLWMWTGALLELAGSERTCCRVSLVLCAFISFRLLRETVAIEICYGLRNFVLISIYIGICTKIHVDEGSHFSDLESSRFGFAGSVLRHCPCHWCIFPYFIVTLSPFLVPHGTANSIRHRRQHAHQRLRHPILMRQFDPKLCHVPRSCRRTIYLPPTQRFASGVIGRTFFRKRRARFPVRHRHDHPSRQSGGVALHSNHRRRRQQNQTQAIRRERGQTTSRRIHRIRHHGSQPLLMETHGITLRHQIRPRRRLREGHLHRLVRHARVGIRPMRRGKPRRSDSIHRSECGAEGSGA